MRPKGKPSAPPAAKTATTMRIFCGVSHWSSASTSSALAPMAAPQVIAPASVDQIGGKAPASAPMSHLGCRLVPVSEVKAAPMPETDKSANYRGRVLMLSLHWSKVHRIEA